MAVKVRERKGAWWVVIDHRGRRKSKRVGVGKQAKRAAQAAAEKIQAKLALGDFSALERPAPADPSPALVYPPLQQALPAWIERKARARDIRGATPKAYASRLRTWVYPFPLSDGRPLGSLPVNEVTREMLGAVILRVKEAGRSLAIIEAIRNPLRGYFAELIETKVLLGPNPAADLKFFVGRRAYKKRRPTLAFFTPEEGARLVAMARAATPRWHPFILTGLLAGLRWGESAAFQKSDIDWRRGRLHVQRTFSEKGNSIEVCKDSEDRWVAASPGLLEALRTHVEALDLEGQVREWTPEQRQLVFPTTTGRIIRHGHFLEAVWARLLAKAGLPYRKYHSTRHTYATWLLVSRHRSRVNMSHGMLREGRHGQSRATHHRDRGRPA